jgi:hypothetical protein
VKKRIRSERKEKGDLFWKYILIRRLKTWFLDKGMSLMFSVSNFDTI